MGAYVFDNTWEKERERLAGLEALFDPGTTRLLDTLGVGPGWRCLEIAGGGGSITQWLCRRVGADGRVVATDIETRLLDALHEPNLEVRRHDIVNDVLPTEAFDLIHSRLLLEHLPGRDQALKRISSALRPGGWLLIEDIDWGAMLSSPARAFFHPEAGQRRSLRVWRAFIKVMQSAGNEPEYGRVLPTELIDQGLTDVGAEGRSMLHWGGGPGTAAPLWSLVALREPLKAIGGLKDREIDGEIARWGDPNTALMTPLIVAAWGRRPEAETRDRGAQIAMPPRTEGTLDWLRTMPLFEGCTPNELSRVAASALRNDAAEGEDLTREGDAGSTFYLVAKGMASVSRQGRKLAALGPGSYFGEIALVEHGPRTATVTAETPMLLFTLEAEELAAVMRDVATVRERIETALTERKRAMEGGASG